MLSGHLCRCTGYAPIVAAIEDARDAAGARTAVNLAQSLLAACERDPELEAFPGIRYGELLPRVRRLPAGSTPSRGRGWPWSSTIGSRRRSSTGRRSGPGRFRSLSWRLSEEELAYCIDDAGAERRDPGRRPAARGPEHGGASTATIARSRSSSTPPARPAARRACRGPTPPTGPGPRPGAPHGYGAAIAPSG